MNTAARLAFAALLGLSVASCQLEGALIQAQHPAVLHDLGVFRLELAEARDAAPSPAVADALASAEAALARFLAERTPENRATKTPENVAAMRPAFQAALDAVDGLEAPPAEIVLARSGLRRWIAQT